MSITRELHCVHQHHDGVVCGAIGAFIYAARAAFHLFYNRSTLRRHRSASLQFLCILSAALSLSVVFTTKTKSHSSWFAFIHACLFEACIPHDKHISFRKKRAENL